MRFRRRAVVLTMLAMLLVPASGGATGRGRPPRGFPLFAGRNLVLQGNRVACNINNIGELCTDPANSPSIAGGYWPGPSGIQYVFNSGLAVAGIIGGAAQTNFPWPGDTVGAFFFDPRGDQQHGSALSDIFSSRNAQDRIAWPGAARAADPALYHPLLAGRSFLSEHDSWARFWDGNTGLTTGRQHAAGLLIDQRTLSFDRPGLEDVVFVIYRLTNISARDAAAYQGLAAAGYGPADIAEIAALGARFQDAAEAAYQVQIPDAGYQLNHVYFGFGQDPDVSTDAGRNFSNANFIMNGAFAYQGSFAPAFGYFPPEDFAEPFAVAPGLVMNAFVQGPRTAGGTTAPISMWSNNTGGGAFPDAIGVEQLWRRFSLNLLPSDGTCAVPNPQARRFCFPLQTVTDTRYWMAAGPVSLAPGASATLIMAQVHAAPLLAPLQARGWPLGFGVIPPGNPLDGARLFAGSDTVRSIDRIAGWVSHADADGDQVIEIDEVVTVPRSLYHKAQLATAIAANGFLTASGPETPPFVAVPGDRRVTIAWQRSVTETSGDPYFDVAANPLGPAYDPNYRQVDVEGYRVWRGTSPQNLQLIAQFDYRNTEFADYSGRVFVSPSCAPELGVTAGCPSFPARHGIVGDLVQIPPGGRLLQPGGVVLTIRADTALASQGYLVPQESGVPFAFTDSGLVNGQLYYYAVTAFDVNSVMSGPSSLESPPVPRAVRPRVSAAPATAAAAGPMMLVGGDGTVLDTAQPVPALDRNTGLFDGPMPPANGLAFDFLAFVPELADSGEVSIRLDSVVPGSGLANFTAGRFYFSARSGSVTVRASAPFFADAFDFERVTDVAVPAAPYDSAQLARFGAAGGFGAEGQLFITVPGAWRTASWGRAEANAQPAGSSFNGPRWWSGTAPNETVNNPNGLRCAPASGTCVQADLSRNAGGLAGVATLFHISGYSTVPNVPLRDLEAIAAHVVRAADFRVYWGAGGVIDSVMDVTHRVTVPFSPAIRASWGVLNDSSFLTTPAASTRDGNNALLTWSDIVCVDPAPRFLNNVQSGGLRADCGGTATPPAALMPRARLSPVAATSSTWANAGTLTATGNGFIFYLNGHFFLMQLAALPAAGTVWNARFYSGTVTGAGGSFAFVPAARPPAVPGLEIRVPFRGSRVNLMASVDSELARVHTVPDPFYLDAATAFGEGQRLQFVNLPARAVVRIYSSSGVLVAILNHNDPTGGGAAWWDLRNRGGRRAASGVYFYHVETPDGRERVGRFVIVYQRPGLN